MRVPVCCAMVPPHPVVDTRGDLALRRNSWRVGVRVGPGGLEVGYERPPGRAPNMMSSQLGTLGRPLRRAGAAGLGSASALGSGTKSSAGSTSPPSRPQPPARLPSPARPSARFSVGVSTGTQGATSTGSIDPAAGAIAAPRPAQARGAAPPGTSPTPAPRGSRRRPESCPWASHGLGRLHPVSAGVDAVSTGDARFAGCGASAAASDWSSAAPAASAQAAAAGSGRASSGSVTSGCAWAAGGAGMVAGS